MPFAAKQQELYSMVNVKSINHAWQLKTYQIWDKTASIPTNTTFFKTIKLIYYCTLLILHRSIQLVKPSINSRKKYNLNVIVHHR